MAEQTNKYDHLFKNMISNSMGGVKIFSSKDEYKKPQEYNNVTNLENGIWEKLFISVESLIDQYVCNCLLYTSPSPRD